jgi:hypothetical protein
MVETIDDRQVTGFFNTQRVGVSFDRRQSALHVTVDHVRRLRAASRGNRAPATP